MATPRSFSYAAKTVSFVIDGVLITGYARDSFVDITYNSPAVELEVGADGQGIRSLTSDNSAKITLRLLQNSAGSKKLDAIRNADRASAEGVVALVINDSSNGTKHSAAQTWIMKPPKKSYHGKAQAVEWELETDNLEAVFSPDA